MTVAYPADQGWLQFFELGALFLPIAQQKHAPDAGDSVAEGPLAMLIDPGARDLATGIMRLPLIQALLTVGSQVPVGGDESPLTYVDLRQATSPDRMLSDPAAARTAGLSSVGSQGVFIKGGTRGRKDVGHLIPQPFWSYLHRPAISPDGWETDFGAPLTEALSFTIIRHGRFHHMLVQAFWRDGLVLDQNTLDPSGQPQIQRLDTGVAYLRTVGPPTVAISAMQTIWAQGDTPLVNAPDPGRVIAHVGQDFPLTLLGDTAWKTGMLWYHVQWATPKRSPGGWVAAPSITFTSPGNRPGWASFDVLSPHLAAYLASFGGNVDAVVYDLTHQRYYAYDVNAQFITGSSVKVPILLTFLDMTEHQGREPSRYELDLLTTMIEDSDNDAAGVLYYGEIGGAAGVAGFLHRIGITGLAPNPYAFGYSLITPLTMVNLLAALHEGKILTAHNRALALYLLEHVQSAQQIGVGDTAPGGATVAMKDGWVPGPDGLWNMNSSGMVVSDQETYIIAVYTQEQPSLEEGYAITQYVCSTVASLLI